MWKRLWIVACGAVLIAAAAADRSEARPPGLDHAAWDALVHEHVEPGGWVDYAGFARDAAKLDAYLVKLGSLSAQAFEAMPRDAQLATLINAYNAFTIRLILDHWNDGKLESIMDIPAAKRWKHERWKIAGRTVSLDQLEHEWIRVDYDEPRIHWALVCAAYSCPPLRTEAYTGDELDKQLADQEDYVLHLDHDRFVQRDGERLLVTPLFKWYGEDWDDWRSYVFEQLPLDRHDVDEIGFLDYSWNLNDLRNRPKRQDESDP